MLHTNACHCCSRSAHHHWPPAAVAPAPAHTSLRAQRPPEGPPGGWNQTLANSLLAFTQSHADHHRPPSSPLVTRSGPETAGTSNPALICASHTVRCPSSNVLSCQHPQLHKPLEEVMPPPPSRPQALHHTPGCKCPVSQGLETGAPPRPTGLPSLLTPAPGGVPSTPGFPSAGTCGHGGQAAQDRAAGPPTPKPITVGGQEPQVCLEQGPRETGVPAAGGQRGHPTWGQLQSRPRQMPPTRNERSPPRGCPHQHKSSAWAASLQGPCRVPVEEPSQHQAVPTLGQEHTIATGTAPRLVLSKCTTGHRRGQP